MNPEHGWWDPHTNRIQWVREEQSAGYRTVHQAPRRSEEIMDRFLFSFCLSFPLHPREPSLCFPGYTPVLLSRSFLGVRLLPQCTLKRLIYFVRGSVLAQGLVGWSPPLFLCRGS